MKRWTLIFILLPLLASAELQLKTLSGFKGLVTNKGDFNTPPEELRVCHDVNLSRNGILILSPRLGSVPIFTFPGADSIIGLATVSYRDGTEQMIAAVDSAGVGYANIYASVLNSDQFGAKIDSTEVLYNTVAYNTYIADNDDDTIVVQHIFNIKRPGRDIQVTLYDTIYNSGDWLESNDTMVARANAEVTLSAYITADTTGDVEDTAYFYKPDKADTAVTFSWSAQGLRLGGLIGGELIVSQIFNTTALTPNERLTTHWGIQFPTDFDQFNDKTYMVNGQQKGRVYNGDYTSIWPANAPGEIEVIPLAISGNLDGEIRYVIVYSTDTTDYSNSYGGYITPPVKVLNGQILLKSFPLPALPVAVDTFGIAIYRMKANPGTLTESDYAYLHSKHINLSETNDSIFVFTITDNTADASLSTTDSIQIIDLNFTGREGDTTGGAAETRFGAPLLVSADSAFTNWGVFEGAATQVIGVAYIVTPVDSANGEEGDSSRPLIIFRDTILTDPAVFEDKYELALPVSHNSNKVTKNLYRAPVVRASYDSLNFFYTSNDTTYYVTEGTGNNIDTVISSSFAKDVYEQLLPGIYKSSKKLIATGDTLVPSDFKLVAQLPDSQKFLTDSIPQDSLNRQPIAFSSKPPPSGAEQILIHQNNIFLKKGSKIWRKVVGAFTQFELFDFASFNLDDGDQIETMIGVQGGGILALKNYTAFNYYDFNERGLELAGVPGCVASQSAVQAHGSSYYMSNRGIMALTRGAALLRYHNTELLSKPLRNFLELPFESLASCVGAYVPQTEQLWWSIGDTTYVYDFQSNSWATSSLTFGGSTLWDTDTTQDFRPGRTFYYYPPNDSILYRFGDGHKNIDGSFVNMKVESGPIFPDENKQQIMNFSIWAKPETTFTLAAVNFLNQGDTLTGDWLTPRVDRRVSFMDMYNDPAIYYRLKIEGLQAIYPMYNGGIDRIDIWYEDTDEPDFE